jgi:lauroyl/myristoyl acyltransferase
MKFAMKKETAEALEKREAIQYLVDRAFGMKGGVGRLLFEQALKDQPLEKILAMRDSAKVFEVDEKRRRLRPR